MASVFFITHPDVSIEPAVPVPEWPLSARGLARMAVIAAKPWLRDVRQVASSRERKAIDGASIVGERLGLRPIVYGNLGENDRSATGYLPKPEFEAMADSFFANPTESVNGWERAVDAQARIVSAVRQVSTEAPAGDVAIVSHGGVGALLLSHLMRVPIGRATDQPPGAGGYVLAFDRADWKMLHGWRLADD